MSDAGYRTITTRIRAIRPKAIFVDKPQTRGPGECAVPRSLIHGADDGKLDGTFAGEEITIRIRDWKAEELGFA